MDFDVAKENIQPLATGRDVSLLQASLCQEGSQDIIAQRKQLEDNIKNYVGDDPLEPWYAYICWIEQSYPAGGAGSGMHKVMHKCLTRFERDARYQQDRRFVKLFIKFMEKQQDQIECYQQMYNNGIGTMIAEFYIAWAYSYDLSGNLRKADEIFRLGVACRAEPVDVLKEAHQHFGYTVGQRTLYNEGDEAAAVNRELNERRLALQSLHGQRRKNALLVGSVRTGAAIKSHMPGVVQSDGPSTSRMRNVGRQLEVFNDENSDAQMPTPIASAAMGAEANEGAKSTLRSIIDAARHQENIKEPGPWNQAHAKGHKHGELFTGSASNDLGFKIHVDEHAPAPITKYERHIDKPFKFPPNFVAKNRPQEPWVTPVCIEDQADATGLPEYQKCMLYPRPNMEFSPEEYRAFCFLKPKNSQHPHVRRNEQWWGNGNGSCISATRRYPNFASVSKPQTQDELDKYFKPPSVQGLQILYDKLYNDDAQQEYQVEELLAVKWHEKRNITVHGAIDMEETVCLPNERMPRRKSFFPTSTPGGAQRKSMAVGQPRVSIVQEEIECEESIKSAVNTTATPPTAIPVIEIYEDPIPLPEPLAAAMPASPEPDKFVVPTNPAPLKKIEIYEDVGLPEPAAAKPTMPFFDADESCSTQMFNIFIKNQAVSTPKVSQKQAPTRQFGTVLRELTPPPAAKEEVVHELAPVASIPPATAAAVAAGPEPVTPILRKQLSTILETSEHATHSTANTMGTTKSTNASTSPGSNNAQTTKLEMMHGDCTPALPRLMRQTTAAAADKSTSTNKGAVPKISAAKNPTQLDAGDFARLELWEPNTPSVPLMRSLRFQEDKTETVPKPIACFQEDKTETLPKLPQAEASLQHTANTSKFVVPPPVIAPLLIDEDEEDICNFFIKTPPKSSKRICQQRTPDIFAKKHNNDKPERTKDSFAIFEDDVGAALPAIKANSSVLKSAFEDLIAKPSKPAVVVTCELPPSNNAAASADNVNRLADSFMSDLSFVPETQPALPPTTTEPAAAAAAAGAAAAADFHIFLDETKPEIKPFNKSDSFNLDWTLPETQLPNPSPVKVVEKPAQVPVDKNNLSQAAGKSFHNYSQVEKQQTIGPAHLTASFMKDCTDICQGPLTVPPTTATATTDAANRSSLLKSNGSSTLKYLGDSLTKYKPKCESPAQCSADNKLSGDFFELNAATEMFGTNISMIKNSTLLPESCKRSKSPVVMPIIVEPVPAPAPAAVPTREIVDELSIYHQTTPLTPKQSEHSWQAPDYVEPSNPHYVHPKANVDHSVLNATLAETNVNPFNVDLINSLLDSIEFSMYIEKLPNCELVGHIKRLQPHELVSVHEQHFEVIKMVGKGAYGSVYSGKHRKTGKKVALKQERPTNYWEYYICLEVQSRLKSEQMLSAYMQIDYALVSNNCSVFISEFSDYGSLINVCNKVKKHSTKNMDEYVVMQLSCQLLDIVDHLHAMGIIHADIKADNFLLMKPLSAESNEICLQLIDFGVAIDTKLFPPNQKFNYVHNDEAFKCIEMRTQRPWTYQLDLYGLVGVMHVMLFGRYMEVAQRMPSGIWLPKTQLPRYFNKLTWETIFRALLNVRDCHAMPNLQELRTQLKSVLADKERYVADAIAKFNAIMKM